ncbi:MAG TPA: nuclear transport factor 2 family protein [Acidimicrobiia bacterium]|nr:nuclear transport factor 2 family protein [Acidimicrobiia bacterium]
MGQDAMEELRARIGRLEDELAIQRLILSYGPAADAGLTSLAAGLWLEKGVYDWDAGGDPHEGSAAVDRMLQGDAHQGLIAAGAAHFAGPPLIEIDGHRATALNYSFVIRRRDGQFHLWRVSAVRWDLERSGASWRVRRRTNRLLDASGDGRQLFGEALHSLVRGAPG